MTADPQVPEGLLARYDIGEGAVAPLGHGLINHTWCVTLPDGGRTSVRIYDVAGRRVKGFEGLGVAGTNIIHWNGRNDQGANESSGVYYYRLKTAEGEASRKMVMVK